MKTLDKAELFRFYKIVELKKAGDSICQRFLELGLTRGQKVRVVAKSLLKKVCLVEIRGYLLSVRTSLLENVVIA